MPSPPDRPDRPDPYEVLLEREPYRGDPARAAAAVSGRRVLLTGAAGSIGNAVARRVATHEPAVLLLLDHRAPALEAAHTTIAAAHPGLAIDVIAIDIRDEEIVTRAIRGAAPDVVFHAAALKHVPELETQPAAAIHTNVLGTRFVAGASAAAGARRFVLISSDKAARPRSVMGATKRLAELIVHDLGRRTPMACSVVRFGNVLASSGSVIEIWERQLAAGTPLTITDPHMTRYVMTTGEAADLVMEAASLPAGAPETGAVDCLDMGPQVELVELARRFARSHGLEPVDAGAAQGRPGTVETTLIGPRPGEKLHEELAAPGETRQPCGHPRITRRVGPLPPQATLEAVLTDLLNRPDDPLSLAPALLETVARLEASGDMHMPSRLAEVENSRDHL